MGSESLQSKLDRVRPPRVQIKYKVETLGAMVIKELPFVVGVLADLSGNRKDPLKQLDKRDFIDIDRDNFQKVLKQQAPRVTFEVPDKLTNDPDKTIGVELNFQHLKDFEPARVAEQVPVLKELLDARKRLSDLLGNLDGKDKVVEEFEKILKNTEAAVNLASQRGIQAPSTPDTKPKE